MSTPNSTTSSILEHYAHPPRSSGSMITAIIATTITLLVLSLRIYARLTTARPGAEDWAIVAAWVFSVALTALIIFEVRHGQGRHIDTISQQNWFLLGQALYASVPCYQAGLTLTKISILLQYWRVFVGTNIRKPIILMAVVTVMYGLWSICSTMFMCAPIAYFWNHELTGHCLNRHAIWFSNAAMNILTDIIIFILPMPVLKELHLPRRQKWALIAVFALGAFVVLTSVLRLKSLYVISVSHDVTHDNGAAAAWSSLELNVGIICASLPTLRKTISRFFPRLFSASEAHVYYGSASVSNNHKSRRWPGVSVSETSAWAEQVPSPEIGKSTAIIEMVPRGDDDAESQTELVQGKIRVLTVTTQEVVVQEPEPAVLGRPKAPERDESFMYDHDARQL